MYIPEDKLRKICSEVNGTYSLYVSLPERDEKFTIDGEIQRSFHHQNSPARITDERFWGWTTGSHWNISLFKICLYDYAVLMIIVSDNSATNQEIDVVGQDRANEFFAA